MARWDSCSTFSPEGGHDRRAEVLMIVDVLAVGVLEIRLDSFPPRVVEFSALRQHFCGENMLEAMSNLVGRVFRLAVRRIPFYFMELLVGLSKRWFSCC